MTLSQRLLLALSVIVIATTVALGVGVREAWRHAEETRFREQLGTALDRLEEELGAELRRLPSVLAPLCQHDPVLDAALLDLQGEKLDPGRRLSLSLRVPELMKAMGLDELYLLTGRGDVLGAGHEPGLAGSRSSSLGDRLRGDPKTARVRPGARPAIEAHCSRSAGGVTLGFHGARRLDGVLARVGESQGLELGFEPPVDTKDRWVETERLPALGGLSIVATRSRLPLHSALRGLDRAVLALGTATLLVAIAVSVLVSRGLARPIVRLSEQARRVVTGDPSPVRVEGGRELEELARSFNQTLADLAALRKRLAATERIAARREIARRVAHEIKNPLMPIRAAVETLRRLRARSDPAFDEYFDEATRTVLGEVQRIADIVQEFTEFARLPPPSPAPMDLLRTVREVVNLHAASGVPIHLSGSGSVDIVADRDQIVQVVTNLLQNAMDAVAALPAPRVEVQVQRGAPGEVHLVVRDNGPGVEPAHRARLFEPYATTKAHGTGLGLPIVHRIVVEHGGDITYRDAAAGGAQFTVTLPTEGPRLLTEAPPTSTRGGLQAP